MTSNVQDKIISLWGGRIPNQNEIQFALSQPPVAIFTLFQDGICISLEKVKMQL